MRLSIEFPKPWTLREDSPVARLSSRPPAHRQTGFDEQFDSKTIFYDCIYVKDVGAAVLQGPPFQNLKRQLQHLWLRESSRAVELKHTIREGDRHAQIWIATEQPTDALRFLGEFGETELQMSPDRNEFFKGARVLLTLNKNNKLEWICDWIRFHRDIHGANAVLLYDNSSTLYDLNELMARLQSIPELDRLCLVSWPFKYGPNGRSGFWDSDFCQYGALENARWRFLQQAKSVLSCDIDELVVTRGKSIFELAESSRLGYLSFYGKWIMGLEEETHVANPGQESDNSCALKHADLRYAMRLQRKWKSGSSIDERCPSKWAVVPSRCPSNAQWMVHLVRGISKQKLKASDACYRHFRQISTNWKFDRSGRYHFDPAQHYVDEELSAAFEKVSPN